MNSSQLFSFFCKKMITTNEMAYLGPRSCCYVPVAAAIAPLESQGGILCSERGQSRDAFKAVPLEETSPRCNKDKVLTPSQLSYSDRCE